STGRPPSPQVSSQEPFSPHRSSGATWARKSAAASTRMSAPKNSQFWSPNEVMPTTVCLPPIIANEGPPLSPEHLPVPLRWSKQRKVGSDEPTLVHEKEVLFSR